MHSHAHKVDSNSARGMLCALDTHVLVAGLSLDNALHAHWSASVLVAGGAPFEFGIEAGGQAHCQGVVVRPGTRQCMRTRDKRVLVVHLDPDTPEYAAVGGWIERTPWQPLPAPARKQILASLGSSARLRDAVHAREVLQSVLGELGRDEAPALQRDSRVTKVCEQIAANPAVAPDPRSLAAHVELSVSRLQHLFREQLGITLTEYARWQRIKRAGLSLQHGYSLTEAAHFGGFADSAHFSRTFRAMFGLPPSALVRGSSAVQVLFAPLGDNAA